MKYRELLEALKELSEEQLDMSASVFLTGAQEIIDIHHFSLVSQLPKADQDEIDDDPQQPLLIVHF